MKQLFKKCLAAALCLCLLAQTAPVFAYEAQPRIETRAGEEDSKPIDSSTFSSLGIAQDASMDDLPGTPYGEGVFATNVLSELYVGFGGAAYSGYKTIDNLAMTVTGNQKTFANLGGTPLADSSSSTFPGRYAMERSFSTGNGKDDKIVQLAVVDDLIGKSYISLYVYSLSKNGRVLEGITSITLDNTARGALDGAIWEAELTALFEMTTGDFDGDGADEIAVFVPGRQSYIQVYEYSDQTFTEKDKFFTVETIGGDNLMPIPSMTVSDMKDDKSEELIVAVSQPYATSEYAISMCSTMNIYEWDNSQFKTAHTLSLNTNGQRAGNAVMARYAGVAAGDLDNDGQQELVVAGYRGTALEKSICSDKKDMLIDYNTVSYNHATKRYENSVWSNTKVPFLDNIYELYDETEQYLPPMVLATAATGGVGYADTLFMGGGLYTHSGVTLSQQSLITDISSNNYGTDINVAWLEQVVAGNFDGNQQGQEQFVYVLGAKAKGSTNYNYFYDVGYLKNTKIGELATYQSGAETLLSKNKATVTSGALKKGMYVSVCPVDVDEDSVLMRYLDGSKTISYTNPEVLVVMQSAPYFQDLADTNDGYLNNGATAFGKSKGSSSSFTSGAEVSAGTYLAFEQDISVFGIKLASIEAETQITHGFSYGYEQTKEITTSIEYAGSVGDDYLVVFSLPYMDYAYEIYVPRQVIPGSGSFDSLQAAYVGNSDYKTFIDSYMPTLYNNEAVDGENWTTMTEEQKAAAHALVWDAGVCPGATLGGKWEKIVVSCPLEATTSILTVDRYDEIAEKTAGLTPIRGNVLHSTPGVPSSYAQTPGTGFKTIGASQMATQAQGSTITVSREESYSESNSFEYSMSNESKVGGGAFGFKAGAIIGGGFSLGGATSDFSGTAYTATVDNLPNDANEYSLGWQFGFSRAKIGENEALVLCYQTKNVIAPPPIPQNLTVDGISADSISLAWDASAAAEYYVLSYVLYDGTTIPAATLPATETTYEDKNLKNTTVYSYAISAISSGGRSSRSSAPVSATTLSPEVGSFAITGQPKDTATYAGGSATFTAAASYVGIDGTARPVRYQWQQKNPDGKFSSITGASSATYTLRQVGTAMGGNVYRCMAYVDSSSYIYTGEATLSIGKADSITTLTAPESNAVVKSSYLQTTTGEPVEGDFYKNAVKEQAGNTYTLSVLRDTDGGNPILVASLWYSRNPVYKTQYNGTLDGSPTVVDVDHVTVDAVTHYFDQESLITFYCDELEAFTPFTLDKDKADVYPKGTEGDKITVQQPNEPPFEYYTIGSLVSENTEEGWKLYYCAATYDPTRHAYFVSHKDKHYPVRFDIPTNVTIDGVKYPEENTAPAQMKYTPTAADGVTSVPGDSVTLTATLGTGTAQSVLPAGSVSFRMVAQNGGASSQVPATLKNGAYTATWIPQSPGAYTVYANYAGNGYYNGSSSEGVVIYAGVPKQAALTLQGENMVYGGSQTLRTVFLPASDTGKGTHTDVTPASWSLSKNGKAVADTAAVLKVSNGKLVFTPDSAGEYAISVRYEAGDKTYTASKSIRVHKDNLKATVVSASTPAGEEKVLPAITLTQVLQGADSYFTVSGYDSVNAAKPGDYAVAPALTAAGKAALGDKYSVQLVPGTYTVTPISHVVSATTQSANGTLEIIYQSDMLNIPIQSGGRVVAGGTITVTAYPNRGFQVGSWTVNGGALSGKETSQTFTVDKPYAIQATFDPVVYTLTATAGDHGTVKGNYLVNGAASTPFTSGGQLSPTQTVRLTATPAEGYVVKSWTVNGEVVKAADGKSPYTVATYDVKNIDTSTTVAVAFEEKRDAAVTVKVQDRMGSTIAGAVVTINNVATSTYAGVKGEQVVISVSAPGAYILDSWAPAGVGTVSGETLTIASLSDSVDIVVTYTALGGFTLKTETGVHGTVSLDQNGTTVNAGTAAAAQAGDALVYTATPDAGYELDQWLLNGAAHSVTEKTLSLMVGEDIASNSVITVKATFKAIEKPVTYSVKDSTGGTLSATVPNDTTLTADTSITFTATPADGYRVVGWYVDGALQDGKTGTTFTYVATAYTTVEIQVKFEPIPTFSITFDAPEAAQGALTATYKNAGFATGSTAEEGGQVLFTATPASSYHVASWTVDGQVVEGATATEYTLSVSAAHNVSVTFASGLAVSLTPGEGYTYVDEAGDPMSGSITVESGETFCFGVVLEEGYSQSEIMVSAGEDDLTADETGLYTIESITESTSVTVTSAEKNTYAITATAGENGIITAPPTATHGENVTITISANEGYQIATVTVDDVDMGSISSHTFGNITQGHSITATFAALPAPELLVSITPPTPVTAVANGTALAEIILLLPETVTIDTNTDVTTTATVTWAESAPSYDPASPSAQTFTLGGTVTLPESVLNTNGVSLAVAISISVDAHAGVVLKSISQPTPITVSNGTALDTLNLPLSVRILTQANETNAATVRWNLNSSAPTYVPESTAAQTFTLSGTIVLPDGVSNPDNVALTVEISITVQAVPSSGGGGGGGGGGGSATPPPSVTVKNPDGSTTKTEVTKKTDAATGAKVEQKTETITAPDGTKTKEETITITDGKDGVTASVTTKVSATGARTVTATVTAKEGETSVNLPAAVVEAARGDSTVSTSVNVEVGGVSLSFDEKALSALGNTAATPTVSVTPAEAETLPEAIRATATAYDFTAGGKGVDFGGGTIMATIAYEKKDSEKAVAVYFVGKDKTLTRVAGATYQNGAVRFPQSHWSTYAIVEETVLPFTDVADTDWHYEAVRYAFEHKLFSGTNATTFAPNIVMNRAMLMTVLARLDGQNTTGGVTYYEKGMAWAMEEGISDGKNPDGAITREQLAAMLYRYAGSPQATGTLDGFVDAADAASYAVDALRWATGQGILTGKGNDTLDPLGQATRAEVAAVLMRYMETINQ